MAIKVKLKFIKIWIFSVILTFSVALYLYLEIDFLDPIRKFNLQKQNYRPRSESLRGSENEADIRRQLAQSERSSSLLPLLRPPPPPSSSAPFKWNSTAKVDTQMLDLYEALKFDNPHGGVWTQGWDIQYAENQWTSSEQLKVFIVPHSHNDPGWLKTFEQYYRDQTRKILDLMVEYLTNDERKKFIWAEISFFSLWWDEIEQNKRDAVKRLIARHQLEFVTGGWVMNDEANTHWFSMWEQLTLGNQWLKRHLNYTPTSSWSIDPFGQGATFPLLLKLSGFENLLIQRVHYSVKKYFARMKQLEFNWRQVWDVEGHTDLFTQMMPFYSYDIPHSCGPDPKICCQFDFRRLKYFSCPWHLQPVEIDENNIVERASTLLDQFRKKAQLYRTNSLLVPLGDDFRYDMRFEWDKQFDNYKLLIDFINENKALNTEIRFGTLSEYFASVKQEMHVTKFPIVSGDFFTYADKEDEFWSGYFTSRPFYKRMDRIILSYIRNAEILLTLAELKRPEVNVKEFKNMLEECRANHALFQHHDGITGTAKTAVVYDYAVRIMQSIQQSQRIIQFAAYALLSDDGGVPAARADDDNGDAVGNDDERNGDETAAEAVPVNQLDTNDIYFEFNERFRTESETAHKPTILIDQISGSRSMVFFNSLLFERREIVRIYVSNPYIEVFNEREEKIAIQIGPKLNEWNEIEKSIYEIAFVVEIKALALIVYKLAILDAKTTNADERTVSGTASISRITFYGRKTRKYPTPKSEFFANHVSELSGNEEFHFEKDNLHVSFQANGFLKSVKCDDSLLIAHLDFVKYGVMRSRDKTSGAYIFMPDREAQSLNVHETEVVVVEGAIFDVVHVTASFGRHSLFLERTGAVGGTQVLRIENHVNITQERDFELAMRIDSSIRNDNIFYTDVNGLQYLKRKRFAKLPIQGNYYPLPAMGWIEDDDWRLSFATSTPLGTSSQRAGSFEIMQDRRLMNDDRRGLAQGVLDNVPVRHEFRLVFERKRHCVRPTHPMPHGYPTQRAFRMSKTLLNPLIEMISKTMPSDDNRRDFEAVVEPQHDLVLVSLRSHVFYDTNSDNVGLVLMRQFFDDCFAAVTRTNQSMVNLNSFIYGLQNLKKTETTLTFSKAIAPSTLVDNQLQIDPMTIKAVIFN